MAFLNLQLNDDVPDEKTIWLFRDQLTKAELIMPLLEKFEATLSENGFAAQKGQIIDATIVSAPKQRNNREENKQIKQAKLPKNGIRNRTRSVRKMLMHGGRRNVMSIITATRIM